VALLLVSSLLPHPAKTATANSPTTTARSDQSLVFVIFQNLRLSSHLPHAGEAQTPR
jgi:hypothetical protein